MPGRRSAAALTLVAALTSAAAQDDLLDALGDARRAGPALRDLLDEGGPTAVRRLVAAHADTPNSQHGLDQRRRAEAALAHLARRDPSTHRAIPTLARALDATRDARRIEALLAALGVLVPHGADDNVRQTAEEHVARLLLSDERRWTAGERSTPLIEGARAAARMSVPVDAPRQRLEALLRGPDALVRATAAELLASHGPPALPALREALYAEHPDETRTAGLIVLVDGTETVRRAAAIAIARIDPTASDATYGLAWLAGPAHLGPTRLSAITALGNPELDHVTHTVHQLAQIALAPDDRLALEAIASLGRLGAKAKDARPALSELARIPEESDDARRSRRKAAKVALRRIGEPGRGG